MPIPNFEVQWVRSSLIGKGWKNERSEYKKRDFENNITNPFKGKEELE